MALLAFVRFSIFLFFALLFCGSVLAQKQEKTLEERLLAKPDQTKVFDVRQGSTFGRQSFETGTARVKNFYFTQRFAPKDYDTHAYGTKGTWFGNFRFSTKEAGTKANYEIPNATKKADTKALPVSDARENSKTMPTTGYVKRDRSYLGPEANRIHRTVPTDKPVGWSGDLRPMTIDDVRELLNKNK